MAAPETAECSRAIADRRVCLETPGHGGWRRRPRGHIFWRMTTPGLARVSGLAFLFLFGVGSLLWWPWGDVRAGEDPAGIAQFFNDSQVRIMVGGTLSVVGIAAFVVF